MKRIVFCVLAMVMLISTMIQPVPVWAAEPVDVSKVCSLELEYSSDGTCFKDLEIRIYRIAERYTDGGFTLAAPFDRYSVNIQEISSAKEWRDAANTLASYIAADGIAPTAKKSTDTSGKVVFNGLKTGIYLIMGVTAKTDTHTYTFENFCIFLPTPLEDGTQDYDVAAKPKCSSTPIPEEPKEITYQVIKLWKDKGSEKSRPKSINVSIMKDGVVQETVVLGPDNDWTYTWTVPDDGAVWTVVEKNVPGAYTVVITKSGAVFTITNTRPEPEIEVPTTGDSFALRPWLASMTISGLLLILLGVLQKRKAK